jgi:hypothetical protein
MRRLIVWYMFTDVSEERAAHMKKETTCLSETSANIYQTTKRHISEHRNPHSYSREHIKRTYRFNVAASSEEAARGRMSWYGVSNSRRGRVRQYTTRGKAKAKATPKEACLSPGGWVVA